MKKSRAQIFLVGGLLTLLGVLAALQYVWLGQISDAERERLERIVKSDAARLTEEFNREIQNAYFNFQTGAELWREKNYAEFNERYRFWQTKTAYPDLIKNLYFSEIAGQELLRYDAARREFAPAEWSEKIASLKPQLTADANVNTIREDLSILVLPVHETPAGIDRILIRKPKPETDNPPPAPPVALPKKYGFLLIELDDEVIVNRLLPDLATKYFGAPGKSEFGLAVTDSSSRTVFQTAPVSGADATARLFNLSPDNFIFFANRELMPRTPGETRSVVLSASGIRKQTVERTETNSGSRVEFKVLDREQPGQIRVFEGENLTGEGVWKLSVQHRAGSLEQFVFNTRLKNLGISFGILSLLAVCIVLIFVSTQRAKTLAQRQVDFVSSVSHEFRTPLAVIFSAGENLADGVAREAAQVSRYGDLIKAEGKKLSKMVEQILEFAGANSGRKKYDLRPAKIADIIEIALGECRSLLDENDFTVEKHFAESLPDIKIDANALSRAIQNLVVNSVKYSAGEKFIKISTRNGGGRIKIVVEDKGIGIAATDLKHIFEPFYRAKAVVDEQIHGNGLGLSLVRETVEAHGGRVSAESQIGKGSKFIIELPQQEN